MSKEVAKRLLDLLAANNESVVFTDAALHDPRCRQDYEVLRDIIHGTDVHDDFAYDEVFDALTALTEAEEANICERCEPDIYTADLTKWLASSIHHVYYLSEALAQDGGDDGITLLGVAQQLAKEEIWYAVLNAVEED